MKSVIVQGNTVAKAIDEALQKADMPQEFFVKILEDAQPGFLGFGSKKAKIALFFKKDDLSRRHHNNSLLLKGEYKDLFNNQKLQKQLEGQDQSGKKVVTEESSSQLSLRPIKDTFGQEKKSNKKWEKNQRPMTQNPKQYGGQIGVKRPMSTEASSHPLPPIGQKNASVVSQEKKESEQNNSEMLKAGDGASNLFVRKNRSRRRYNYGYRSRNPQWSNNKNEASDERVDQNTNQKAYNEPKDSE